MTTIEAFVSKRGLNTLPDILAEAYGTYSTGFKVSSVYVFIYVCVVVSYVYLLEVFHLV